MKPRIPSFLAVALLLAAAPAFSGDLSGPKPPDPALLQKLGMDAESVKDLCSYVLDVLSEGPHSYWTQACEPGPNNKLAEYQTSIAFRDDFSKYNSQAYARKSQVQALFTLFAGPDFSYIKDDSSRAESQKVYKCFTKEECLSTWKKEEDLAAIDPPVNARTFPAWLPAADANKMLPFLLILENEKIRLAKYKELQVPIDEKERGSFCKAPENKDRCQKFEEAQKQIATNKAALDGMKNITDPEKLARFMENAMPGKGSPESSQQGVLGQWQARRDDPSLPLRPQQRFSSREAPAPAPAQTAPASGSSSSFGIGGITFDSAGKALGGIALAGGALLAWRSSRKKGEEEAAKEDQAAVSGGEFVPAEGGSAGTAGALTPAEQALIAKWEASAGREGGADLEGWLALEGGQIPSGDIKSLQRKIQSGQVPNRQP